MSDITLEQVLKQRSETSRFIVNVDEPVVKLVIFDLGGQRFALSAGHILEILAQADVFFVPGSPPSLEGVINLRGDIESVIRLHEMLHVPDADSGPGASILLGRAADMRSGIRVDRVLDVTDVPQSMIEPPPATLSDQMRSLVLGVLEFQGRPVALLDLDKLFGDYALGLG